MGQPFLTLYTPTYKRPESLKQCMASVAAQTAAADIEHLIIPDYVGVGIVGVFERIPTYAPAVHGRYVHILGDDDQLADPECVADVQAFAAAHDDPPLMLVQVRKGPWNLPTGFIWPPALGHIDLACLITRADVWKQYCGQYGRRYEGDFDFAHALWKAGIPARYYPRQFAYGEIGVGLPELAAGPVPLGWSA